MDLKQAIRWAKNRKRRVTYQSIESSLTWYVFKLKDGYAVYSSNEVERLKLDDWVYKTK